MLKKLTEYDLTKFDKEYILKTKITAKWSEKQCKKKQKTCRKTIRREGKKKRGIGA